MEALNTFLKNLFGTEPSYKLGSFTSPDDPRNISVGSFQNPVELPIFFETVMPDVENQKSKEDCCSEAVHKIIELYFKRKGIEVNLSGRDLHRQCKENDGIPMLLGTYPSVTVRMAYKNGVATTDLVPDNKDLTLYEYLNYPVTTEIITNRKKHRIGGYAFVSRDYDAICQAIFQNEAIVAAFSVDKNWFKGTIKKVLKAIGRHMIVLNGFDYKRESLIGFNSWGITWIGYMLGKKNKNLKPGHFEARWKDIKDDISDMIIISDIPSELIEQARAKPYTFTTTMKYGSSGSEVIELQKFLGVLADGKFGAGTEKAVKEWQTMNGLVSDGIFGYNSRMIANKDTVTKVGPWKLYPLVQRKADELMYLAGLKGYKIRITEGFRSNERQGLLYAQGRTLPGKIVTNAKAGESFHNFSVAIDICFVGKVPYPPEDKKWKDIADIGKSLGFTPGYYFGAFKDMPHFEYVLDYSLLDFRNNRVDYGRYA